LLDSLLPLLCLALLLPGVRLFFFVSNLALLHSASLNLGFKCISFTADVITYLLDVDLGAIAVNWEIDMRGLAPELLDGNFVVRTHDYFLHIS
jgi:hypothetical protein